MSEASSLSENEIKRLANTQAERETFVKSTIVFVSVWLVGFLTFSFVPERHYRILNYDVTLPVIYFVGFFFLAFFAGLFTRWIVKDSAYEKYYALYKEQQKQPIKS